jgi:transcriptional regulator with XRE-family HTH domain
VKKKTFGEILGQARAAANLTQKELAARLRKADGTSISAQYLNDIERGRRLPPSDELIRQLAAILHLAQDVFFHYAGRLPPDVAGAPAEPKELEAAYATLRRDLKLRK